MAADGLCPTCTRVTSFAIAELPRDYVSLHEALQHGSNGMADLVAATPDPPAPLRVNVAALMAELVQVSTSYAEPVAELLRIDWDSQHMDHNARPGYVLQRACRLLAQNMPVLLALRDVEVMTWSEDGRYSRPEVSDGITGALQLLELHYRCRAMLGQTKLVHQLPTAAACPSCGGQLVRDNGESNVHCRTCRTQWSEKDYRRLVLVVLSDKQTATR